MENTLFYLLFFVFDDLWDQHPALKPSFTMFGQVVTSDRYLRNYGKAYTFPGNTEVHELTPEIQAFVTSVNNTWNPKVAFDQVLINWYPNPQSYLGPHRDVTRGLHPESVILIFS